MRSPFFLSGEPLMTRLLRTACLVSLAVSVAGCAHFSRHKHAAPGTLAPSHVTTIGVNSYLWRAALDTVSFMPLVQTDSNGGVIVTDWYANPNTPTEQMKLTVTILDQDLRADAVRVAALKRVNQGGQWVSVPVDAATVQKLEDIILTRARDLRRAAVTE
jgi:hypothetical protein